MTTPGKNRSRRISIDELNSTDEHTYLSAQHKKDLLSTPSPPRDKHNQTRHNPSFLATPVQTHLFHEDDEENTDENRSYSMFTPYTHKHKSTDHSNTLSPTTHRSRLLPPTTPKTRNTEMFLSPSPKLKSPNGSNSLITKDTKPIREISNDLKTRLNYAFVKLQNGWVDKTLPELEEKLDRNNYYGTSITTKFVGSPEKFKSPIKKNKTSKTSLNNNNNISPSSYVNQFAYGNGDGYIPSSKSQNDLKIFGSLNQYHNKFNTVEKGKDIFTEDSTTSAHLAFLQALASPRKKTQNVEIPRNTSPLKWDSNSQYTVNKSNTSKLDKSGRPVEGEKEVVETLMSLSSPQKPKISKKSEDSNSNNGNADSDDTEIETEIESD